MKAYVHTKNANSDFIYNSQKTETAQVFINKWMDKQILEHPFNGILLSNKKGCSTNTWNDTQMNLKSIMLKERSQAHKAPLYRQEGQKKDKCLPRAG